MIKFLRDYELLAEAYDGQIIEILGPGSAGGGLTLEFSIERNMNNSANKATFQIYNLGPNKRNRLRKSRFQQANLDYKSVVFRAGYSSDINLPVVFSGNIGEASSIRNGPNWITTLECFGGLNAYNSAITGLQFEKNTPIEVQLATLFKQLPNVEPGVIGNIPGSSKRSVSISGPVMDNIKDVSRGANVFIDNGKVNVLTDSDFVPSDINLIDSASGIIGVPQRSAQIVTVELVFEPRILVGQRLAVVSETLNDFSGIYKVVKVAHTGTISNTVGGDAKTKIDLLFGTANASVNR